MNAIRWWVRPAILALFWLVLAATTVAELTTVGPALNAAAPLVARTPPVRLVAHARQRHARRSDAPQP
jgi:hypothetical protein